MKSIHAMLAAAALLAAASVARADCAPSNPIFTDSFTDQMGGWDPDDNFVIADGAATVVLGKGSAVNDELNNAFMVKEGDVCVIATFPTQDQAGKTADGKVNQAQSGVIFGAKDYKNFFLFSVETTGRYGLWRKADSNWQPLIDLTASPAIKGGFGATNQIEVKFKDGVATVFANGQKLASMRVQTPESDARFGLYGQLDENAAAPVPFKFKTLVVNPAQP